MEYKQGFEKKNQKTLRHLNPFPIRYSISGGSSHFVYFLFFYIMTKIRTETVQIYMYFISLILICSPVYTGSTLVDLPDCHVFDIDRRGRVIRETNTLTG